ncbi:MAG: hypothetical protein IPL22_17055 [Bacteroidetes bacterium]|nr:hypothetical protein [Bacteroidota bacterium]
MIVLTWQVNLLCRIMLLFNFLIAIHCCYGISSLLQLSSTYSFPANGTVANYQFNNLVPGVSGINYNVTVSNCTDVMWSLMPVNGSDVTISNSTLRVIGAWFTNGDTAAVSGLVNNSNYTSFTAPF